MGAPYKTKQANKRGSDQASYLAGRAKRTYQHHYHSSASYADHNHQYQHHNSSVSYANKETITL